MQVGSGRSWIVVLLIVAFLGGCAAASQVDLTAQDREAILDASRAYTDAWRANDPEAVMATFVDEPVLSPSGLPYQEGQQAARSFWWPAGGPPTMVTRFDVEELEVGGSGDMGYVRGTFLLEFEYDGSAYTNHGKFVHLLERVPDLGWRISHHLWNDLPRNDGR